MHSIRRAMGYLAGAGLLAAVGVGGAELASGAGKHAGPSASAERIGTKQIRDGSLLFKDFKPGELSRRFPTRARLEAFEKTMTERVEKLTKLAEAIKFSGATINAQSNEMQLEQLTIAHEGLGDRLEKLELERGAGILTLESGRGELLVLPELLALDGEAGQSPVLHMISKGPALEAVATTTQGSAAHSVPAGGSTSIPLAPGTQVVDLQVVAAKYVVRIHVTLTDLAEGAYRLVATSTTTTTVRTSGLP